MKLKNITLQVIKDDKAGVSSGMLLCGYEGLRAYLIYNSLGVINEVPKPTQYSLSCCPCRDTHTRDTLSH